MRDSPPHAAAGPPPDDVPLFGRSALLREVRRRLREGQKVLLVGPAGTGKSALIRALLSAGLARELDRTLVFCPETSGVRAIVEAAGGQGLVLAAEEGCETAWRVPRRPSGGVRDRRSALYRRVQKGRWLFVLDHLCSRDPAIRRVLEFLFDYDVLTLGATRGTRPGEMGNISRTVWRWELVKVPLLPAAACRQLADHLTAGWPLGAGPRRDFCDRLLRLDPGNPGAIVEVCRRAAVRLDGTTGKLDPLPLWLDWLGERRR